MTYPQSGSPQPTAAPQPPQYAAPQYPQPGQYPQGQQYPQQHQPYQQYPQQHPQPGQLPGGQLQASYIKHTGMLIWWQQSTTTHTGTFEELQQAYSRAQTHNLLAGWWSISSVVAFNWWAIFRNMYEYHKVKKAAGR